MVFGKEIMNSYIDDLIKTGMGNVISSCADSEIMEDEYYQKVYHKAEEAYSKLKKMGLSEEQLEMIEKYVEYINTANARSCNISFLVGARNAILLMNELNAFKDLSEILHIHENKE